MKLTTIITTGLLTFATAGPAIAQTYTPSGPVERKYSADGPWAVTTTASATACDRKGDVCDLWYPTDLGTNPLTGATQGFHHPVIVFADGTADSVPATKNAYFLHHLATWGFVVVRARDGSTGQGDTTIDAANYILALGNQPGSVFQGKLDPANVGLTGHSQGAGTALLLFGRQTPLFKTYVPIETPIRAICVIAACAPDLGSLPAVTKGSIFLIGGQLDVVSPLPTNLGYYIPIAGGVDKVMGMISKGSHLEIEGDPDCAPGTLATCNIGVYPLLGFPTAWFMWKLQGASDGRDAFRAGGELSKASPNWSSVQTNVP